MNFAIAIQELDQEIAKLQRVRAVLYEVTNHVPDSRAQVAALKRGGKRVLSAAARQRIAAAQRARWAKWHKAQR